MDQRTTPGQIIAALPLGAFALLAKVTHGGSLEARRISTGVRLYWRSTANGKTTRAPIGMHDTNSPPKSLRPTTRGYSIAAAMVAADELAKRSGEVPGGYAALQEQQRREEKARWAKAAAKVHTLAMLLDAYCDRLQAKGRKSHGDARSIFNLHIPEKIRERPANEIEVKDVTTTLRALNDAGHLRTANKLRSYWRAAYQTALAAPTNGAIPEAFEAFGVHNNPVASTVAIEGANRADKRPLSTEDMQAYWRAIKPAPGIRGAMLRLHLLTGGQRIEQLVNLFTNDIGKDHLTLYDGKGRPGHLPRKHLVPLTPAAATALHDCTPVGAFALSTDNGRTHVAATSLSAWAVGIAKSASIDGFQLKRVRSGVETLLTAAGVSKEHRGRLQSHGISGVQDRNYNAHEYLPEKRKALTTLHKLLEATK